MEATHGYELQLHIMYSKKCARAHQGLAKDDLLAAERCHFWANGLVASSRLVQPLTYDRLDGRWPRRQGQAAVRCFGPRRLGSPGWREVAAVARNLCPAAPVQPASAATWREALVWEW